MVGTEDELGCPDRVCVALKGPGDLAVVLVVDVSLEQPLQAIDDVRACCCCIFVFRGVFLIGGTLGAPYFGRWASPIAGRYRTPGVPISASDTGRWASPIGGSNSRWNHR
jgi:hypothetical protein